MNYYPFHLGDYAAHTAHLEPMEDLAYRRMLDLYYRTEKPLPSDWRDVARLIRLKDFGREIESILSEFFELTPDGWRHGRCDAELSKMQDKQAKARASAAASVSARSANAQRTLNGRSTKVELPTPTPTPTPTPIHSVAIATGAVAPASDPSEVIFGLGVPLLTAAGVSERNARSMLGLMRKMNGDAAVMDAISRCADHKPVEPVAWLQATLKSANGPNKPCKAEALMASNIAAAKRFIEGIGT